MSSDKTIKASFYGKEIEVDKFRIVVRNINDYYWYGKSKDQRHSIMISVLGNDIRGVINSENEIYEIETIIDEYVLVKLSTQELNKKECGLVLEQASDNNLPKNYTKTFNNQTYKSLDNFDCKLRVLILFTQDVNSNINNLQNFSNLTIEQMNQTFIDSQIDAEVELAHIHVTNYNAPESFSIDRCLPEHALSRFSSNGDGYMDEVHDLRVEYSADICVLICDVPDNSNYAGLARSIKSSSENAFCLVDYAYCIPSYTFAHEIGHLIGCRHDIFADNDLSPYIYGHGKVVCESEGFQWRTIMGINPSSSSCQSVRLGIWSNPNLTIPLGIAGDEVLMNNSRVIMENIENILSYRPTTGLLVLNQAKANQFMNSAIYSSSEIVTEGFISINSNQSIEVVSNKEITFVNGFSTFEGSEVSAQIQPFCGLEDGLESDYSSCEGDNLSDFNSNVLLGQRQRAYFSFETNEKIRDINIFPNPTTGEIHLSYTLVDSINKVKIIIVNFNGSFIAEIRNGIEKNGIYSIVHNVNSISSGTYFIIMSINDIEFFSQKLIKL